jgi:hypothetical protein
MAIRLLLCLSTATPACWSRGECDPGATRCFTSGSLVETQFCDHYCSDFGCEDRWRSIACPPTGGCLMLAGEGATCVLSTTPDPRCAGVNAFCDGDDEVTCRGGYAANRSRCGAQDPALPRCVTVGVDTACVPAAAAPDGNCPAGLSRYCSAQADLVECVGGDAVFRSKCRACSAGARGSCTGFLGAFCAADADCASGLTCRVDALGRSVCTAPCTVTATGDDCLQALGTGGLPYSHYSELAVPGRNLLCAAGFCAWQ